MITWVLVVLALVASFAVGVFGLALVIRFVVRDIIGRDVLKW